MHNFLGKTYFYPNNKLLITQYLFFWDFLDKSEVVFEESLDLGICPIWNRVNLLMIFIVEFKYVLRYLLTFFLIDFVIKFDIADFCIIFDWAQVNVIVNLIFIKACFKRLKVSNMYINCISVCSKLECVNIKERLGCDLIISWILLNLINRKLRIYHEVLC